MTCFILLRFHQFSKISIAVGLMSSHWYWTLRACWSQTQFITFPSKLLLSFTFFCCRFFNLFLKRNSWNTLFFFLGGALMNSSKFRIIAQLKSKLFIEELNILISYCFRLLVDNELTSIMFMVFGYCFLLNSNPWSNV